MVLTFVSQVTISHQMETFSALLTPCVGNSPVTGAFPSQRPVTWSFDAFFDLRLNKRLNKKSRRRWFETQLCPLGRHCNVKKDEQPKKYAHGSCFVFFCGCVRIDFTHVSFMITFPVEYGQINLKQYKTGRV